MPNLSTYGFVDGGYPWVCKAHIAEVSGGKKVRFPGVRQCRPVRNPVSLARGNAWL